MSFPTASRYNKNKIAEMLKYYESKGANLITLDNLL